MSWYRYRINDRVEQEQLDICRALIEDATPDTVLWLQANPSPEERVHVLAIQGLLAELARIIECRMERRREAKDDWVWSETVDEVKSRLEKAGQARGSIVGKGLARIAARLPQELPGPQPPLVSRAPSPASTLRGGGVAPSVPTTQIPPNPPSYFPGDLWPETNLILLQARKKFPYQKHALELCKHITSELTPLFCKAVKTGKMEAGAVLHEGFGGMEDLLHLLLVYNDDGPRTGFGLSDQAYRLGQRVRQSDEWLALAKAIVEAQDNSTGTDRLRTDEKQAEASRAQNSANSAQNVESKSTDRRTMVKAYIEEVRSKTGKRITKKDIWSKAGYQTRTEFERWERQDGKHPNQAADENFTRILREKPHLK